jgi:hypothetical protein
VSVSPVVSTRASSWRARDGTRTCCPSASTVVPGRSRIARRYESVATSRRPVASAARSTPVRIGRASSLDAARTTCDSAVASSALAKVTGSPPGSAIRGNSSAGSTRRLNSERPAEMRASSASTSTSTLPAGRARTMSDANRPGRTTTPSPLPETAISTEMVSSRSVPVSRSWSPLSSTRTPDRTGSDVPRPAAARPALPRASTRTSRSHRNFTPWLAFYRRVVLRKEGVVVVLWIGDGLPSSQVRRGFVVRAPSPGSHRHVTVRGTARP